MAENKVQITIEAIDKAKDALESVAKGLKGIQDETRKTGQESAGLTGILASLKSSWVGISIGINQALEIISKIRQAGAAVYDFVKEGQKVVLVETSFHNMATSMGADAEAMISRLKTLTKGVMDDSDLMRSATEMMLAGAKPDQIESLTGAMAKLAPYAGMTLPEGLQRLTAALESGNARQIRAVAGYIDLNYELEVYANKLGLTAARLTDTARVQATAEIIIGRMTSKTKDLKDTQELGINTFLRFETAWKNMVEDMQKGLGPLAAFLELLTKLIEKYNEYSEATKRSSENVEARRKFAQTPEGQAAVGTFSYEKSFQEWQATEKKKRDYQLAAENQDAAKGTGKSAGGSTSKEATPLETLKGQLTVIQSLNDEEAKRRLALEQQLKIMAIENNNLSAGQIAEIRRNELTKISNEFSSKRMMIGAEILKQSGYEIQALEKQKEAELILTTNAKDRALAEQKWNQEIANARLSAELKLQETRERALADAETKATEEAKAESEGRLAIVEARIEREKALNEMALRDGRISEQKNIQEQARLDRELIEARIKAKEEGKLFIPLGDTAAITKALSEIVALREQLAAAGEKGKGALTDYDRRMELSWAEAQQANLIARINRTRELNQLKVAAGEMRPGAALIADVQMEQEQIRAGIELLEIRKKSEPLDSKRLEYAQEMIRLQGQLKDAEMIRLKLMEYTGTLGEGLVAGLKKYANAAMTAFQEGVFIAQGAAKAMEESFGTIFFDAMQGKLKKGVDYWRQFVASIEKMLSDLLAKKLMEQIIGTQSQASGGNYGGLLGMIASYYSSSPSTASPQPGVYTGVANSGYEMATVGHSGRGPGEHTFYRIVPSAIFENASRYHMGKGEVPAIIKEDESIFTPGQLRALGRAQKGGAGPSYNITMNVNAIDSLSFQRYALQNKAVFADAIRAAQKENHPARRGG